MKRFILLLQLCIFVLQLFAQQGQLSIARIDQMPDSPLPLQIRDWNAVAQDYDSFVFNVNKTGIYLPLSRLGTQGQFNYADNTPLFLDSYVGSGNHLNQAEAINILPAIVGASLVGIDKSNQNGMNWVAMAKDFYNLKNGQNVYLNSYSTQSGNDWWYDVMPNVYFYQMKSLYPAAAPQFSAQFNSVADRWLNCVKQLGGSTSPWTIPNMNYRAFNLSTGLPLTEGVQEPESAGSIAWLLYNAYLETGNRQYMEGARQAMDFLIGLTSNPSYELQLPYGTIAAARMNAVEGTNYSVQKLLTWCFDRGDLRGWGAIVGNWNGYDVSGLIGEANDNGNDYAFVMNGFQQAAALAPLPKYDKRYARALAKWMLNVTNASRLFYSNGLPQANQDSYSWASANDPTACIPHESMKQVWQGTTPFATGDAIGGGWAATNLSLYSGSGVGYLASVVKTTNVPGILQIDLNKTDFYGDNSLPSFLYFNPTTISKDVTVNLPSATVGIYDAITETIVNPSASGTLQLTVPAGEVRLIRFYQPGVTPESRNNRLYVGNNVLDYHYNYNFATTLHIKALSASLNPVVVDAPFNVYSEPGNINPGDQVKYEWFLNDVLLQDQTQGQASISASSTASQMILKSRISFNGQTAEDTLHIKVVNQITAPPVVTGIESASDYTATGASSTFTARVTPTAGETLTYAWSVTGGTLLQSTGNSVRWQAPAAPGVDTLKVIVTNQDQLSTTLTRPLLVKNSSVADQDPLIWYPFDNDSRNQASDRFHATVAGAVKTEDARGNTSGAYRFTSGQNIISTPNVPELNFTSAVSLSCWVKCEELGAERYIISHGSWQQRYKLSIIPEGKFRWTVKTDKGVTDLDAATPIELNRYYHVTALYTGYSIELYIDGKLNAFKAFSGNLLPSTHPLTIARQDEVETQYALLGSIDEVKVWDREIPVSQVEKLKDQWWFPVGIAELESSTRIYPNPSDGIIYIEFSGSSRPEQVSLFAADGRKVTDYLAKASETNIKLVLPKPSEGIYLLKILMKDGKVVTRKIVSK